MNVHFLQDDITAKAVYDGIEYRFHLENFSNVGGYANILIHDVTHDERYHSNGYLEVNGHVIISKWKYEYNANRDNWNCIKDLLITIN